MKKLIIVESPAKIKTISKFLGKEYVIMSTMGHIKDLPPKELGVSLNDTVDITYIPLEGKEKTIADICKTAKKSDVIFLAPDPDREGEIIAWHINQDIEKVFKNKKLIHRISFNEVFSSHPLLLLKIFIVIGLFSSQKIMESRNAREGSDVIR